MVQLAEKNKCTGCGACSYVCPKSCISMSEDEYGALYPKINHDSCIQCRKCVKTCPVLSLPIRNKPREAYAAYSLNSDERLTSASGGVAMEIYKICIEQGCKIGGATFDKDFKVKIIIEPNNNPLAFKNSKYVYSNTNLIYDEIKLLLNKGYKCVIIALPCQIAAIRKVFNDNSNLILVDIVCHGTTPHKILKTHIEYIESLSHKKNHHLFFRDPNVDTMTFSFSLYDKNNSCFYRKKANEKDMYQFGYHKAITYRENCYNCIFANDSRVSDITLSDYKGLGRLAKTCLKNHKLSSVLVNTEKGHKLVQLMIDKKAIFAEKRPTEEPILGDKQLREPSKITIYRKSYLRRMNSINNDFEKAIIFVYYEYKIIEGGRSILIYPYRFGKRVLRKIIKIIKL